MESMKTNLGLVNICSDQKELGKSAAETFAQLAEKAIAERGRFVVGLSGGHTPPALYSQLTAAPIKSRINWSKVHFFMSDERCVPPDHKDSNWGMAEKLLFSKLTLPAENLHPMHGQDADPKKCAEEYEEEIKSFFQVVAGAVPRFDLIQLGMGPDGHTASLFPGSRALKEQVRLVIENVVNAAETKRLTFTFPMLNHAANIMFLVEGAEKSHVFAEAMRATAPQFPVQKVSPSNGSVIWFVDQDCARDMKVQAKL